MSTISLAHKTSIDDHICQGDIFSDVKYNYIDHQDDHEVEIIEYVFPIVISQACDVNSMSELTINRGGKPTKFMPAILMCPIYGKDEARSTKHLNMVFREFELNNTGANEPLYTSKDYDVAKNDWHYRYHALTVKIGKNIVLDNAVIDYKH